MERKAVKFLDFLLPRFCISCNKKLKSDEKVLCDFCKNQLEFASSDRLNFEYQKKFASNNIIKDFRSLYIFKVNSPIQDLIHSVKYHHKIANGYFMGNQIALNFNDVITNWSINLIIPVPLHHLKKAERGFNQSALIAKAISKRLKIPFKSNIVKRKRYTQTQTQLSLKERQENMLNAFNIKKKKFLNGENILVIDDVITTGATITECGKILKENGANNVYAMTFALAD